jgi:hypothetical protein
MKAVELGRAACRRNHAAKENHIRSPLRYLIHHLIVVQPQGTTIQDRDFRGAFLTDKGRDLRVQGIDG